MTKKIKILMVEDSAADAGLIQHELKREGIDFVVTVVSTKVGFEKELIEFIPDVILCDHSLPQFNSMEALRVFLLHNVNIPFILVTGSVSEEFAVESLTAGADDYILKSSLKRLPSAIYNAIAKKTAENEREINFRKLQDANAELKTFIYRSSHDIRQPVSSILGLIELTKKQLNNSQLNNSETTPLIEMMDNCAKRLDNILLQLIEVIRVKDDLPEKSEVDFHSLITDVIDQLKYHTGYEKIKFSVNVENITPFYSDESMLISLFQNLIGNAIQYRNYSIPNPFVNINVKNVASGLEILVSDNGIGIKNKLLDQVFEMFYRGTIQSNGLGLGLYLTKNIVDKLNGIIKIDSVDGKSTTVSVFFPC
ncbi:MAG: response regulator [Bacteroidetes bacterium]|nr:response regulator [Bacteroidota bacterium]